MHPGASQPRPRFWQEFDWSSNHRRGVVIMCVLSATFLILGIFSAYLNGDLLVPSMIYFFLALLLLIPPSIICFIARKRYFSQLRFYRNIRPPITSENGPNSFVYPVASLGSLPRSSTNLAGSTTSAIFMVSQATSPMPQTRSHGNTPPPSYEECVSGRTSPYQEEPSEMHPATGDSSSYPQDHPPPFNPVMMSTGNGERSRFLPERISSENLNNPPSAPLLSPESTFPSRESPRSLSSGRISPRRSSSGRLYPGRESPGRQSPRRSSLGRISPGRTSSGRVSPGLISPGREYPSPGSNGGEASNSPQIEITHYGHI